MLRNLTVAQYDNWYFYSQHEPFGYPLENIIQANITSAIFNATGRFDPFLTTQDCLLSTGEPPADKKPEPTSDVITEVPWQELKQKMRGNKT